MQSVVVRVVLSAVLYTVYLLITDRAALKIRPRDCVYFIGTGICSLLFFYWCYFSAIEHSTMAVAAVLLYTAPIFVVLMSAVFFKEKLTKVKVAALVLAFGGCVLVTGVLNSDSAISTAALLFGLGSGFGYALYSIFGKFALRKYSSKTVTVYSFIFAAAGSLPFARFAEIGTALVTGNGIIGALCISILGCILPYIIYTDGLGHVEPGQASMLATLEPVVAAILGITVYREAAEPAKLCGIALVIGAICMLNITSRKAEK